MVRPCDSSYCALFSKFINSTKHLVCCVRGLPLYIWPRPPACFFPGAFFPPLTLDFPSRHPFFHPRCGTHRSKWISGVDGQIRESDTWILEALGPDSRVNQRYPVAKHTDPRCRTPISTCSFPKQKDIPDRSSAPLVWHTLRPVLPRRRISLWGKKQPDIGDRHLGSLCLAQGGSGATPRNRPLQKRGVPQT